MSWKSWSFGVKVAAITVASSGAGCYVGELLSPSSGWAGGGGGGVLAGWKFFKP